MDDNQTEEQIAALVEEFNTTGWAELAKLLKRWGVEPWGWRRFRDIYHDLLLQDRTQITERLKAIQTYRVHLGEKSEVSTVVKLGECLEAAQQEE